MRRDGVRDDQWERIKDLLPGRPGSVGATAADNRLFVETVLYRYRAGIPWRDLPEGVVHFWPLFGNKRARESSRPLRVGSRSVGLFCAAEAVSLPGSGGLVLQRPEAQQGEPVRMVFAGHQFPRALADALDQLAAHVAPMVEEEPQ
jgi:putative transposase of IS4/5 family DUF4096